MKKLICLLIIIIMLIACDIYNGAKNEVMLGLTETETQTVLTRFEKKDLEFLSERTALDIVEMDDFWVIVNWTEQNEKDLLFEESTKGPMRCPAPQRVVYDDCTTRWQCKWIAIPGEASPSWHCYTWTYCEKVYCK